MYKLINIPISGSKTTFSLEKDYTFLDINELEGRTSVLYKVKTDCKEKQKITIHIFELSDEIPDDLTYLGYIKTIRGSKTYLMTYFQQTHESG